MSITVSDCRQIVGEFYRIPKEEMLSKTRKRRITRPRQMAMTLARELTDASLTKIARQFNIGDHTTVISAIDRIGDLELDDIHMAIRMEEFRLVLLTFQAQQAVMLLDA